MQIWLFALGLCKYRVNSTKTYSIHPTTKIQLPNTKKFQKTIDKKK